MWRARRVATLPVVAALIAAGCSADREAQTVTVFAASSLTDVFEQFAVDYETAHPDVDVRLSFGGSSSIVAQVAEGAPADVLATADRRTMDRVPATMLAGKPTVFATNEMVIAVEAGNPLGVGSIDDLVRVPVIVLADEQVPAGAYARDVIACEGVDVTVRSYEQNVRAAAAKVALGEADAAIVYRTDVTDGLDAIEIDPTCNVRAEYPIVQVGPGRDAASFVDFVTSDDAATVLEAAGFDAP